MKTHHGCAGFRIRIKRTSLKLCETHEHRTSNVGCSTFDVYKNAFVFSGIAGLGVIPKLGPLDPDSLLKNIHQIPVIPGGLENTFKEAIVPSLGMDDQVGSDGGFYGIKVVYRNDRIVRRSNDA